MELKFEQFLADEYDSFDIRSAYRITLIWIIFLLFSFLNPNQLSATSKIITSTPDSSILLAPEVISNEDLLCIHRVTEFFDIINRQDRIITRLAPGLELPISHVFNISGELWYGVVFIDEKGVPLPGFVRGTDVNLGNCELTTMYETFTNYSSIPAEWYLNGLVNLRVVGEDGIVLYPGTAPAQMGRNNVPTTLSLADTDNDGSGELSRQHNITWVLVVYNDVIYAAAVGEGYGQVSQNRIAYHAAPAQTAPQEISSNLHLNSVGRHTPTDPRNPHEGYNVSLADWIPNTANPSLSVWVYLLGNNPSSATDAADILSTSYTRPGIYISINGTVFQTTSEYIIVTTNSISENQFAGYPFVNGTTWLKFSLNDGRAVLIRIVQL